MQIKKFNFDLETTGTNYRKHGIHHIAALVEIDGEVIDQLDYKVRPNPKAKIDPKALEVGNVTEEEILAYPPMEEVYSKVTMRLTEYVDRFNKMDKFTLVGYNILGFDQDFFRAWFQQNGDNYFGSWFWSGGIDVFAQASDELIERRPYMPNFKLATVAKELGIKVDETKLHDAMYDVYLTRKIYYAIKTLNLL